MHKQTVYISPQTGRTSPVYHPPIRFQGGSVKWYEDKIKEKEADANDR